MGAHQGAHFAAAGQERGHHIRRIVHRFSVPAAAPRAGGGVRGSLLIEWDGV